MQKDEQHILTDGWMDEVLKTPPAYTLSNDFAEKVAGKVSRRFAWQQYFREFLIYLGSFIGIVAITVGMAFTWLEADWQAWQKFLLNNATLVVGINILGLFVLFADRVLLRYFFFRFSRKTAT